jgi:2,3-dihydro-2,3-dihydroxybenzoate dehydrogenase
MDRCVIVTGAARGLGKAMALAFAVDGAHVVLTDVLAPELLAAQEEFAARGLTVSAVDGDICAAATIDAIEQAAVRSGQPLTVLVNNAGVITSTPAHECPLDEWEATFAVNLTAPLACAQMAIRQFRRYPGLNRSIINLGSINAAVPRMSNAAYCVSKAALASLTKVMALDCAKLQVRVNTLSPGSCGGAMAVAHYERDLAEHRLLHGDLERFRLGIPLGRLCAPADVAATALFLASDAARHITGQELFVDGGQSIT